MGRVALITGGAQGIGAGAARRFLQGDFDGAVLLDRNGPRLEQEVAALRSLGRVVPLAADLRDEATPARAVDLAMNEFGRLDVLVNAAGNTERCGISDATPDAYARLFDINVKAPLFLMQKASEVMIRRGGGVIINIASMLAYGGPPQIGVYSGSKAALVALSKNAANAWKRQGIRVFCINLGWAFTEGEDRLQREFHKQPPDWADAVGSRMPFGRLIKPEDIAGTCAFLASPDAAMMTGAVIDYEQMPIGTYDVHPAVKPD